MSGPQGQRLAAVTYLVEDYDAAIAWFTARLGFKLVSDTALSATKRWVEVEAGPGDVRLLLAKATTPAQHAAIGAAAGDRVAFFLYTDDIIAKRAAMESAGVAFVEDIRREPYGKVCVFEDLYGNRWDLLEPAKA